MVESGDLVTELPCHIHDQRHLVGTVAMIVDEDVASQHADQRFVGEVARDLLVRIDFRLVFPRLRPGRAVDREIAHAGRWHPPLAAIDTLGILAARHLHAIGRTGEFHPLDGARGNIFEHHRTATHQVGRTGQDLQARDTAIGERTAEARVLRPDAVFCPYLRGGWVGRLVAVRTGLDGRRGIDAEMAVDVDYPRRDELAAAVDRLGAGGDCG